MGALCQPPILRTENLNRGSGAVFNPILTLISGFFRFWAHSGRGPSLFMENQATEVVAHVRRCSRLPDRYDCQR